LYINRQAYLQRFSTETAYGVLFLTSAILTFTIPQVICCFPGRQGAFQMSCRKVVNRLKQALFLLSIVFLLCGLANAYTVVMRNGRRVEIGRDFAVSETTLTYEVTPGIQITMLLATIDIAATERANNETPGSLMGRVTKQKQLSRTTESPGNVRETKSLRSLTNRELEPFARVRLESERAYEQKLKEIGLPPLAVLRAQAAAEAERFWQEMARKRAEAEANERAIELQAQMAALSAKLNYVQARIGEVSYISSGDFTVLGGFPLFSSFGRSRVNPALFRVPFGLPVGGAFGSFNVPLGLPTHFRGLRRNVFVAPGTQVRGRGGFGHVSHGRPRSR
jgi:hypothetical protein